MSQEKLLSESREAHAYAAKSNMPALLKQAEARVTRQAKACDMTRAAILELEKATGALPLDEEPYRSTAGQAARKR